MRWVPARKLKPSTSIPPPHEQPDSSLTLQTGHIADRCAGLLAVCFGLAGPDRAEGPQGSGATVDAAEREVGEADDPVTGLGLCNTDGLADERLAEEDEIAAPSDLAVGAHAPHRMRGLVVWLLDARGIGARAWLIPAGRGLLAERLVRPLVVVRRPEAVEAPLLGGERAGRRSGGL